MPFVTNMYKLLFFLVAVFIGTPNNAQQSAASMHIQSESNEAFYVQWKGSSYSSSSSGYLVIPQVPAGEYTLIIAFPGRVFAEYALGCTIGDIPKAFSLKQGIDNSLSLFDMVNFSVTRGSIATKEQLVEVMGKPQVPLNVSPYEGNTPLVTNPANKSNGLPALPRIRKIFDKASEGGIDQVYIIVNGTKADTIALFIQALEEPLKQAASWGNPSQKRQPGLPATETVPAIIAQGFRQNQFSK